jgi:cytochrome c peroxidase
MLVEQTVVDIELPAGYPKMPLIAKTAGGEWTDKAAEERGMALFSREDKGNCAACHTLNLQSGHPRDSLFTDFTYYATGVPRNAKIPRNADPAFFDLGLCGPDRAPPALPANAPAELTQDSLCGKFRMPTLRNVAERPAFMHNGAFTTLREVVVFYANRHSAATSDDLPAKYQVNLEKSKPPFNRSPSAGPALNEAEINDMLSFLRTLSDGFTRTP